MRRRTLVGAFLSVAWVLTTGCSSSPSSPTTPASTTYDGTWVGSWTSGSDTGFIDFCVGCRGTVNGVMEPLHHDIANVEWGFPTCTSNFSPTGDGIGVLRNGPDPHIPVSNSSFNTGQIGSVVPVIVTGTFSSSSASNGTIQFVFSSSFPACRNFTASWAASKR
jgi:hypothetical protein